MFLKLAFFFIAIPFLEVAILIQLGSEIGVGETLLLIIVTGLLGAALARWQGLKVWRQIQGQLNQGRMPAEAMIDGLLIFAAGLVLLTPGLVTDLMGFLLLIPLTRRGFKKWLRKKFLAMSQQRESQMIVFLR